MQWNMLEVELSSRLSAADVLSTACQRMRGAQLRAHNRISYSRVRNWWHVSQCLSTCVLSHNQSLCVATLQ